MKKLKNLLLYCGLSREMYYSVRNRASEENRKTISSFTLMSAVIFTIVALLVVIVNQDLSLFLYIIPTIIFLLMWLVNKKIGEKYLIVSDILAIIFVISLLAAGVFISVKQSTERTTLLLPFFVFASLTFSFRVIYLIGITSLTEIIYILLISQIQTGNLLTVNIINTLIFCIMGTYVGVILMLMKYRKYEAEHTTKYLSEMDALTNTYNRHSYDKYIKELTSDEVSKNIGIAIFDIDYFKKYNDYYGHSKGDEVLINIAKAINEYVNTCSDARLFRYGGEEFVVVVNNAKEEYFKKILIDINRVIYDLKLNRDDIKEFTRITVSVGGAIETIPSVTNDFITNADNQLYYGKNNQRNNVYYNNECLLTDEYFRNDEHDISGNYIMSQVLLDLCANANDIYSVDCKSKRVTVYRSGGKVLGISRVLKNDYDYESSFKAYIENNIHPLDKEKVYKCIEFDTVYKAVKEYGMVNIYYRVLRDNVTSFFKIQFMPMGGDKDNFTSMVCAFLPEFIDMGREQNTSLMELDDLTSVYTRQAFYHYAKKCIDENPNKHFNIVLTDVENFRFINRIYGDTKGNSVLIFLAREFSKVSHTKVIGRYSHDQFVLLVEGKIDIKADEYQQLSQIIKNNAPIPYLTVKFGICTISNIDEPINAICEKAALALVSIKHHEDHPIAFFDDSVFYKQYRTQMLETSFEKALANNEFKIYCQPKYNTLSKKICGGEALLKWVKDNGETISPSEFIPVFEKSGMILRLDEYVFRTICEKQKELIDKGIEPYPISVNVSRNTLYMPSMLKKYIEIIDSYGLDKRLVPIEITETWAIENYNIKDFVSSVKQAGFMLHLDDFGSGYSSLASLSTLPIDVVKLDKSLIDNIGNNRGEELLRHIINLAHFMDMEVIAEGVETKEQYDFLKGVRCEAIQGYYFAKAISFEEYVELLK